MNFDYVVLPILVAGIGAAVAWFAIRRLLALRAKNYSKTRRWVEGMTLSLAALAAAALVVVSGGNALMLAADRSHLPGQFYQVNGHSMRMECMGSGEPTIVLDAGLGNDGFIWGGVQPRLATTTRVCSFDRAGFGYSEAVAGTRDADHITGELHGLLQAAGIDGPIVLMGHSIAGMYIRDYASRYPEHVVGLVFVDGSTPLQDVHPAFAAEYQPPSPFTVAMGHALYGSGVARAIGSCSPKLPGFSPSASRLQADDSCRPGISSELAEFAAFHRSGEETAHTGPYGDLPILIFSQDTKRDPNDRKNAAMNAAWEQMQENLKKLSTRSRRIVAKTSSHYVQIDRPDLILKEVPVLIAQIRDPIRDQAQNRAQETRGGGAAYGSTTTQ